MQNTALAIVDKYIIKIYHQNSLIYYKNTKIHKYGGDNIMISFIKRAGAIMAAAALVVTSGLFSMQVKAASRPNITDVSVSSNTVAAGGTVTVSVAYTSDSPVTVQINCYNPYVAYDYNLNSYGISLPGYAYGSIGGFSASGAGVASAPGVFQTVNITVPVPSTAYGSYTISAKVTNDTGSDTGSGSLFVNNTTMDTAKPSLLSASVGTKNDGNKQYVEIVATATDDYSRPGQTSSSVASVSVAFENVEQPGTWTKTVTLYPVNKIYVGRIDISSIETPGTYVLNYAQVIDTSGNIATYKKSGTTLKSSSSDVKFFPSNLNKVTFQIGDVAGQPVKDNKNETTQAETVNDPNVSPKTSENGVIIPALIILAVVLSGSVSVVTAMAKHSCS